MFVGAVRLLAYKRLPLLAFSVVFTVLFAAYTCVRARRPGCGRACCWLMLAVMWLFNIRPLRKALISRPFLKTYLRLLPTMSQTEKRSARSRHGVVGRRAVHRQARLGASCCQPRPPQLTAEEQAFLDGPCEELCAHGRRLGRHAPARRPAARGLGVHQVARASSR